MDGYGIRGILCILLCISSAESEVSTTAFLLPSFSRHLLCLVLCKAKGSCALVGYCAVKEVMLEDWSSRCVVLVAAAVVI